MAAFTQPAPSASALEAVPHPPAEPTATSHQPLQIPSDLPGSQAPPIRLPAFDPRQPQPERLADIERLFRALPELPAAMQPVEGAAPLSLAELQDMALRQSPVVHQAMADVQAARGAAIQAGALPNPSVAFQEDNCQHGQHRRLSGRRHLANHSHRRQTGAGAAGSERRGAERRTDLAPHAQRVDYSSPLQLLRRAGGQRANQSKSCLVGIR